MTRQYRISDNLIMDPDSENYISLRQATKLCDHSQDYLNLLVRKGRLRAVKMGRNWVTTKEWLQNYLDRVEGKKSKKVKSVIFYKHEILASEILTPAPEAVADQTMPSENAATGRKSAVFFGKLFRPAVVLVICLMVAFVSAGLFFVSYPIHDVASIGSAPRRIVSEAASAANVFRSKMIGAMYAAGIKLPQAAAWSANVSGNDASVLAFKVNDFFKNKIMAMADYLLHGKTEVVAVSTVPVVDETVLQNSIDVLQKNIDSDTADRLDQFRKEFDVTGSIPAALPSTQQGTVVVPLEGDMAATKENIIRSFSDQVAVNPVDDTSGIIVPQFKDKQGQDYLYMMVPVKNN